jgi:hypothetical protein
MRRVLMRPITARFLCADEGSGGAPNNGMHPTRDTLLLIYLQRLGRAGEARRYALASV